ncbi:MAG TPA: FecR domain-containing protein, partial [Myxococcales bacterium]|nr:FecR domain-containing protein [Myxococcales bacterium]
GMDLHENDKVRTSSGAGATINFTLGGTVAMGQDALIALAETRFRPGIERTDLTVLQGRVDAKFNEDNESISVTTPHGTVRAGRRKIEFQ